MRIVVAFGIMLLALNSCVNIVAENRPGKPDDQFPEFMHGKYDLVYPESLQAMIEAGDTDMGDQMVTFDAKQMTMKTGDSIVRQNINDSVSICKVKSEYYLCIGEEPELTIFWVKKKDKDLELYPMFCMGEVTETDLKKYFRKVVANDEEGLSYSVEIDPKKLKAFFASGYPSKDPFVLKRK